MAPHHPLYPEYPPQATTLCGTRPFSHRRSPSRVGTERISLLQNSEFICCSSPASHRKPAQTSGREAVSFSGNLLSVREVSSILFVERRAGWRRRSARRTRRPGLTRGRRRERGASGGWGRAASRALDGARERYLRRAGRPRTLPRETADEDDWERHSHRRRWRGPFPR